MSLIRSLTPRFARSNETPAAGTDAPVETIRPAYEVRETDDAFELTAQLPGVTRETLELTAEDNEIRIFGRRAWKRPETWTSVHRETADSAFELVLSHERAVNLDAIQASLTDGILRIKLPKAEALKPRKITVA